MPCLSCACSAFQRTRPKRRKRRWRSTCSRSSLLLDARLHLIEPVRHDDDGLGAGGAAANRLREQKPPIGRDIVPASRPAHEDVLGEVDVRTGSDGRAVRRPSDALKNYAWLRPNIRKSTDELKHDFASKKKGGAEAPPLRLTRIELTGGDEFSSRDRPSRCQTTPASPARGPDSAEDSERPAR